MECTQLSLFGKMYQERSVPTAERTSASFWKNLPAWNSQTLLFLDLRGGGRWSKAGAIAGAGWSLAWRQLDAQHWGVPQRRKRIALVVDFAGRRAGEILFERESLQGHPDQSIPTWQKVAGTPSNGSSGNDRVAADPSFCIAGNAVDRETNQNGTGVKENIALTLNTVDRHAVAYKVPVLNDQGGGKMDVSYDMVGTLRANAKGHDPIVFDARGNGDGRIVPTITDDHESRITDYTAIAVEHAGCLTPWDVQSRRIFSEYGKWPALYSGEGGGHGYVFTLRWIVRRLTPMECERLQGYPDGWTDIGEWVDTKGKKHKPADGPRYKALGNSIALPQWFWIVQKMKPYMRDGAKLGSLFDGIGGFPLVWETTYGAGTAAWASEIEEFPIAVTKKWFGEKEVKS